MGPKSPTPQTQQLFGYPLDEHLNLKHPLIQLAALIDWSEIDKTFSGHFVSDRGRPALQPRLVAGLLYLQHTFDCSDELVVNTPPATSTHRSAHQPPSPPSAWIPPPRRRSSMDGTRTS